MQLYSQLFYSVCSRRRGRIIKHVNTKRHINNTTLTHITQQHIKHNIQAIAHKLQLLEQGFLRWCARIRGSAKRGHIGRENGRKQFVKIHN